jgi:hypothetical protein
VCICVICEPKKRVLTEYTKNHRKERTRNHLCASASSVSYKNPCPSVPSVSHKKSCVHL